MTHLFAGATLVHEGRVETADLLISGDRIVAVGPDLRRTRPPTNPISDVSNLRRTRPPTDATSESDGPDL